MKSAYVLKIGCLAVLLCCATMAAFGDEVAEQGRAILAANREAVITAEVVVSYSYGGNSSERESEATATVIDPSGLAVLSLSVVDPSSVFASRGDEMVTKVSDLKMLMANGSEVTAEVVLRDKDLDLAFIRPVEPPAEPMTFVSLDNPGHPELLDQVVALAQLGKVARREYTVFPVRIEAIVDKPRTFYVPGEHRSRGVMCSPVFLLDGKFVGIGALRMLPSKAGGGPAQGDAIVIVVPAEDIRESARQVPPVGEHVSEPAAEEPATETVEETVAEEPVEPVAEPAAE